MDALESAKSGPVAEGSVGGGTGMNCYQFKGGSGTASRSVDCRQDAYTVGVFVQANFGRRHELVRGGTSGAAGVRRGQPDGSVLPTAGGRGRPSRWWPPMRHCYRTSAARWHGGLRSGWGAPAPSAHTSLATCSSLSPPVTPAPLPGSKTRPAQPTSATFGASALFPGGSLTPFYEAVVQATQEAVLNSVIVNEEMVGRGGHRSPALPRAQLKDLRAQHPRRAANH